MAILFASAPRMFVLRARRDTVLLVAAAVAATLVLAHGHNGKEPVAVPQEQVSQTDKGWAGDLALAQPTDASQMEILSSASLVVPKSQLALPTPPPKPVVRARPSCDSADRTCVVRQSVATTAPPQHRQVAALEEHGILRPPESIPEPGRGGRETEAGPAGHGLLGSLNPLDHLPTMPSIGHPLTAVGNTVRGWIQWF